MTNFTLLSTLKKVRTIRLKAVVFIFLFACFSSLFSQVESDTLLANKLMIKGDSLLGTRQFQPALGHYQRALSIYQNHAMWQASANCHNKIAEVYFGESNFEAALNSSRSALENIEKLPSKVSKEQLPALNMIAEYYENFALDFKQALSYYEKTLQLAKELYGNDSDETANAFNAIAIVYAKTSNYLKASENFSKTLEIRKAIHGEYASEMGPVYSNLGLLHNMMGRYESSIDYLKRAIEVYLSNKETPVAIAKTYLNLGITYENLGDYEKAEDLYNKALVTRRAVLGDEHPDMIQELENLSMLNVKKGRLKSAMDYSKKSLDLITKLFGDNHPRSARTLRNLGEINFHLGNFEQAISFTNRSLEMSLGVLGDKHIRTGSLYSDLGRYQKALGNYEKALESNLKALEIYELVYGPKHPAMTNLYRILGLDYENVNNDSLALSFLQRSHDLNIALFPATHPHLSASLNELGAFYYRKGMQEKAQQRFTEALAVLDTRGALFEDYGANALFANQSNYLEIFGNYALSKEATYRKHGKKRDLEEAVAYYRKADSISDFIRQYYNTTGDKINFSERAREIYTSAVALGIGNSETDKNLGEKAFYYSEKSKSSVLKELSNISNAYAGLPDEIRSKENDLKTSRAFYLSKLANEAKSEDQKKEQEIYKDKLFGTNRSLDSLFNLIRTDYPNYFGLKYDTEIFSVNQIQERLNDQSTLIEYVKSDQRVYAFVITKDQFEAVTLDAPQLNDAISAFKNAITNKDQSSFKQVGHRLYQNLVQPLEPLVVGNALIIVPDEALWNLNFELLLSSETPSKNPKEYPYLLRKYAISYANSANLLFNRRNTDHQTIRECLAFSFADSIATNDLDTSIRLEALRDAGGDLPGTRKEISTIAEIIRGQYFYGEGASESNFKKNAGNYAFIHLALHGEVDNENPENSRLYFTKNNDTIEDNLLYSHELFALELPADLAVLSACNTGSGKLTSGEGIMSLGNAFQYAGTRSLLMTHWKVSDEISPQLMKFFYTNLKEGMDKATALQQAKLAYLDGADVFRADPFYWGSFYLVGDATPISLSTNYTSWYLVAALLILAMLFFLVKRSKK